MQVIVRPERRLLAAGSEHDLWCMLELTAPPALEPVARRPLRIALVLDRSGSMAGRKLEVTRASAAFLVRRMAPGDELALVTYDEEAEVRVPLVPVEERRDDLLEAIEAIRPGGSTNLSGGYLKGVEVLSGADRSGVRRVLLLSDGLANVGITAPSCLRGFAERALAREGVTTSTIGLGADFDEELMTAMADAGGGTAHFAETPDDAPAIFGMEFSDLIGVVAQDVSVEIRPEEAAQVVRVLNDVPIVPVPGGIRVHLGDAFAEERRRVVFRLRVPGSVALGARRVAEVVVRYAGVGSALTQREVRVPVVVDLVAADEAAAATPDRGVTEEVALFSAAEAGERARRLADAGDLEGARRALEEAARGLETVAPGSPRAQELLEEADFWSTRAALLLRNPEDRAARKRMLYRARSTRSGRRRAGR